jgi:hypothetical protein
MWHDAGKLKPSVTTYRQDWQYSRDEHRYRYNSTKTRTNVPTKTHDAECRDVDNF